MHTKTLLNTMSLAVVTLATLAGPVRAQQAARELATGGEALVRLRGDDPSALAARADTVQNRLRVILADPTLSAADVRTVWKGADCAITVKHRLLVTVTTDDAAYNDTTVQNVAHIWKARLRKALPKVNVARQRIQVSRRPLGQGVRVGGSR